MYKTSCIKEIKEDFLNTLEECEEITAVGLQKTGAIKKFIQGILRLLAPLL